jgi:lysylphosphatidylglycerol synthetase-like protein (DUF2156 family)
MATGQTSPPLPSLPADRRALWSRRLAVAAAVVFGVSAAFPAVAAFVRDRESWPKWWGVLDVLVAFVLALLALAALGLARGKLTRQAEEASYRAYRILIHGILAALVAFFLLGERIVWGNCLTGFAGRAWLLLYVLPAWLTVFGVGPGGQGHRAGPVPAPVARARE